MPVDSLQELAWQLIGGPKIIKCAGVLSYDIGGSNRSREESLHSTSTTASSSAPVSAATATSPQPTSTAQGQPFTAASTILHAAAPHSEQQPLLAGAPPSYSSSRAADPHVETAVEACATSSRESPDSPLDDFDIISQQPLLAATTNAAEPAGDAGLAGSAEYPGIAESSHSSQMHPLLASKQRSAGHHTAGSEPENVPVADPCEIVHDQQKHPEHFQQQSAGASLEEAAHNVQEPAKSSAMGICSPEVLGLEDPDVRKASIVCASIDREPGTQDVIGALGIPFPGVSSDQLHDGVELMDSFTQEQPRAAADQPASDVNLESKEVTPETSGLHSLSGLDQAGVGMIRQAGLNVASPRGLPGDQQASWGAFTGTAAAAQTKRESSCDAEMVHSGRLYQHHRAPARGFPLLDWTLGETKVATSSWTYAFCDVDNAFAVHMDRRNF